MSTEISAEQWRLTAMINRTVKGKMPSGTTGKRWAEFHSNWKREVLTARELAENVWRGWAFCPNFTGIHKRKENFVSAGHLALDFDTQDEHSSFDGLMADPLTEKFSSFLYSTPSSQPDKPRSRVVFIFDDPITDLSQYERILAAFAWRFPHSDQSTVDGLRLFYGSPGCDVLTNWSILSQDSAREILFQYDEACPSEPARQQVVITQEVNDAFLDAVKRRHIERLASAPDGEKHRMLNRTAYLFGGYVAAGYWTESQAVDILMQGVSQMSNVKDSEAAENTIRQAVRAGTAKPVHLDRRYEVPAAGEII